MIYRNAVDDMDQYNITTSCAICIFLVCMLYVRAGDCIWVAFLIHLSQSRVA